LVIIHYGYYNFALVIVTNIEPFLVGIWASKRQCQNV